MTEHRSRLVVITSDVHGGGAEYALGSLATSSGEPVERVRAAVVAAIRHSASCGEPVRTEVVR